MKYFFLLFFACIILLGAGCNNAAVSVDEAMETCETFPTTENRNCIEPGGRLEQNPTTGKLEVTQDKQIPGCISPDPSIITREECIDAVMHGKNPYSTD